MPGSQALAISTVLAAGVLLAPGSLRAESALEPRLLSCSDPLLPDDLQALCEGLTASIEGTMADTARYAPGAPVRGPAPLPLPPAKLTREFTLRGIPAVRERPGPLRPAEDRGVGVRFRTTVAPIQFSTEFVQPGDPSATEAVNWELRTEVSGDSENSGLFWGARTGGHFDADNHHNSAGGFLGLRGVVRPTDTLRVLAEVRPILDVVDLSTLDTAAAVEPRLSASAALGEFAGFAIGGSMDFGYRLPLDGSDPSQSASVRITLTAK